MSGKPKFSLSQTKLKLSIAAMCLAFLGFILVNYLPNLEDTYSTMLNGLLAIITVYSGSNLGQEWMARKNSPSQPPPSDKE